jgi:hypothetical protein
MHFRQAMNHAVAIGAKHRVSALRRQESKKAKDGLPAAMFVNSDPIPGLVRRIEGKAKKRWSKRDFPETNLLIAGSIPERSGAASMLIWDPKLDVKKLNPNLSPTLRLFRRLSLQHDAKPHLQVDSADRVESVR